jgi:hypothetical protein
MNGTPATWTEKSRIRSVSRVTVCPERDPEEHREHRGLIGDHEAATGHPPGRPAPPERL